MIIRQAREADADGINGVYNPYIVESPATFETEVWDEARRRAWIAEHEADPRHPVFVAEMDDGAIIGFANASAFDPRQAYGPSVKTSVFVTPEGQGKGVGQALYGALFSTLDGQDLHRAYGLIVTPNPSSVALHKAFGFAQVATLDEVGRKFGRYYSVMWFEKRLQTA